MYPQIAEPPTHERSTDRQREDSPSRVRTDGGTSSTEPRDRPEEGEFESEQARFQALFVDITGTEELVERQHRDSPRVLDEDGRNGSVSDYLTDIARDDGLAETRSNPEPDQ